MKIDKATGLESNHLEISNTVLHSPKAQLATAMIQDEQLTQMSNTVAQSQVAVAVNQSDGLRLRCWEKAAEVGTLQPLGCLSNA